MKLPLKFPTMVLTDNSVPALQRLFNDLGNELSLITRANNFPDAGPSAQRPQTTLVVGDRYFDVGLGKPIWWNGSQWVDATGAAV